MKEHRKSKYPTMAHVQYSSEYQKRTEMTQLKRERPIKGSQELSREQD